MEGVKKDGSDTECEMRKGQAPAFVVSNKGDFSVLLFFLNSLNNFTVVPCSAAEQ